MTRDIPADWNLSPSAFAMLRVIGSIEAGKKLDLFDYGEDIVQIERMVASYRGSLYDSMIDVLERAVQKGRVDIITQRDLIELVRELWQANVSRLNSTEEIVIQGCVQYPGFGLTDLADAIDLTYAQTRRAYRRLESTGVVRIEGLLDVHQLGLERMLIILENPNLVLSSPYIERALYVDGHYPTVYLAGLYPQKKFPDIIQLVKSVRNAAENATVWKLSDGQQRFSSEYYSHSSSSWEPDYLHFRLALRREEAPIVLGEFPVQSGQVINLTKGDLSIIDCLRRNYESSAEQIATETGLSKSNAFKKRKAFLNELDFIKPRTRVNIPDLSERLILRISAERAGNIVPAWNVLPLTYVTRIQNLENPEEHRVLLMAAVPPGSSKKIINILDAEISRVEEYQADIIAAGNTSMMSMETMLDHKTGNWKWNSGDFIDARTYGLMRREADKGQIPFELS